MAEIADQTTGIPLRLRQLRIPLQGGDRRRKVRIARRAGLAVPDTQMRSLLADVGRPGIGRLLVIRIGVRRIVVHDDPVEELHRILFLEDLEAGLRVLEVRPADHQHADLRIWDVLLDDARRADVVVRHDVGLVDAAVRGLVPAGPVLDLRITLHKLFDIVVPGLQRNLALGHTVRKRCSTRARIGWISIARLEQRLHAVLDEPVHLTVQPAPVPLAGFRLKLRPAGMQTHAGNAERRHILLEILEVAVFTRQHLAAQRQT